MSAVRENIKSIIGIKSSDLPSKVEYKVIETTKEDGYERQLIEYNSYDGTVAAFLLIPKTTGTNPAMLINHQHNGERHLGKSEVCGLVGDPLQAFGPALAKNGFVVLAPDSICFEDRRKNGQGISPLPNDDDFLQHYNEMCYRLIKGETLMKKVLLDAMNGISLLSALHFVDSANIGALGHSYGGNTALFLSALDERISFGCASGSACTYQNRMKNGVGIEMSSVIPGFHTKYDVQDLVRLIAPRRLLIVSADDDKYSRDADFIVEQAKYKNLRHRRFIDGHAMTQERFDCIINFKKRCADKIS